MSVLLHHRIAGTVKAHPYATAVVYGNERISYSELEHRSNKLANALRSAGSSDRDRVCITIPKSLDAIVAILATLKAGCIYTPIDMNSPAARIARIIDSCEPTVVLSSASNLDLLKNSLNATQCLPMTIGVVDSPTVPEWASDKSFSCNEIESSFEDPVDTSIDESDIAYILFTSGSTGMPKGVPISHRNVVTFVDWANSYFNVLSSDRLSGHTALHFDLSMYDIYGTLFAGAELHLVPPDVSMLPNKTADFIRQHRLTQWFSVPSVLNYMHKFDAVAQDDFPELKRVLWCGEVLPTPTLIHWMQRLPHVTFTNLYGPTEATIASSYYTVPSVPVSGTDPVPIGSACGDEFLAILNDELRPVQQGETGDLFIGGAGLSSGYWRDEDRTNAVFIESDLGWIYRTGDLAYENETGEVCFVGRSDTQIKSRGYRIELGEIETALSTLDGLVESAVVAVESNGFEGVLICCAYSCVNDLRVETSEIRDKLRLLIPDYMLPARWAQFKSLPKNTSGKIDRVALRNHFTG